MADTPKHSVSVAGIVVDDQDRVLVIRRRDNGRWEPPGGVLELGETPEDGVRREVLEETGLRVQVDRLSGVYKNLRKDVVALVFRCSLQDGEMELTSETSAVKWADQHEIEAKVAPAYSVRIFDALSEGVPVRSHDGTNIL